MNFNDYASHIRQKDRLAVAIAIVRNTPKDTTPSNYLERLRNNINSEMDSYDINVCEEDFDFNDDTRDNYINNDNNNKIDFCESIANNESTFVDSQSNLNDSMTILKDFNFNEMVKNMSSDNYGQRNNSVTECLMVVKGINAEEMLGSQDHTQSTFYESSQSQRTQKKVSTNHNFEDEVSNKELVRAKDVRFSDSNHLITKETHMKTSINTSEDATICDSQKTISYTLQGFMDDFTHVSQSQVDNIVLPRHLIDKAKLKDVNSEIATNEKFSKLENNILSTDFNLTVTNQAIIDQRTNIPQAKNKVLKSRKSEAPKANQTPVNTVSTQNNKFLHDNETDIPMSNNILPKINDKKKHKYETQPNIDNIKLKRSKVPNKNDNTDIDLAYFNEIKRKFNSTAADTNLKLNLDHNLSADITLRNQSLIFEENLAKQSLFHSTERTNSELHTDKKDSEISQRNILDKTLQNSYQSNMSKIAYNSQNFSEFSQEFESEASGNVANEKIDIVKSDNNVTKPNNEEGIDEELQEDIIEDLFDEITESQAEIVPFKVLEELNKIKMFLNKGNRRNSSDCVSDSGYKSDSQSRNSFKSALQSSSASINQSAYCLLGFLARGPLVASTADITDEISRTLGLLINRLHEEEKYPSFLEELLGTVERLLKRIYEEDSADNQLMDKENNIRRLFLLNKSSHIIKYTIEKIIAILEIVQSRLTQEELLELNHTIETENLCYVFHILETLIKKLILSRSYSSQSSTQNSQEEVLKKSSITDVWRKKWSGGKIEVAKASPCSKPCVLVQCREVLNDIIVRAMDGYSLVSYHALQCFNLLQN